MNPRTCHLHHISRCQVQVRRMSRAVNWYIYSAPDSKTKGCFRVIWRRRAFKGGHKSNHSSAKLFLVYYHVICTPFSTTDTADWFLPRTIPKIMYVNWESHLEFLCASLIFILFPSIIYRTIPELQLWTYEIHISLQMISGLALIERLFCQLIHPRYRDRRYYVSIQTLWENGYRSLYKTSARW